MDQNGKTENSSKKGGNLFGVIFVVLIILSMLVLHLFGIKHKNDLLTAKPPETGSIELSIDGNVNRITYDLQKTNKIIHIICSEGRVIDAQYLPND